MFKPGDGMIRLGDATSHGGKVITGQSTYIVHGKPVAVVGDKVTCPADGHGGVCTIVEGNPTLRINGKQVAFHGCHTSCGAALVSSMNGRHMIGTEEAKSPPVPKPVFSPAAAAAGKVMSSEPESDEQQSIIAPGFHVAREAGYRDQIQSDLLPSPSPDVDAMFERLNTHLPDYVLPGSLIVLSDPENQMCMAEEQTLQDQARLAQQTVQQLKPEQAKVMIDNWGAMMDLADEMSTTSSNIGNVATAISPLKTASAEALDELARTWETSRDYAVHRGSEILGGIEDSAKQWMNQAFELGDRAHDLKAKIGVASSHAVHTVQQALSGLPAFHVPTVADGIRKAGTVAKTLDVASYVGFGLDVMSTQLTIERSCSDLSAEKSCRQVQFEEYGGLVGRVGGGVGGAVAGTSMAGRACVLGVGIHPAGRLACTILLVGTGGAGGGVGGGAFGREMGSVIYEVIYDGDPE